jgi:hypothetical protein
MTCLGNCPAPLCSSSLLLVSGGNTIVVIIIVYLNIRQRLEGIFE